MNFLKEKSIYLLLFLTFLFYFQGVLELPVMDRDEARFATASKTMLENENFIDIQMHDEARYKKPIGIYWIQSFSNYLFGKPPYDEIWIYRLPSLIGIISSLIVLFIFLRDFYTEKVAFLSVYFLTFSFLTVSEMHQAKTDASLFLSVIFCNLMFLKGLHRNGLSLSQKIIFWISQAVGVLIKGPIIFIFTLLPILVTSLIKKNNLISLIWSKRAFLIFLIISVPWFVLISYESDGLFWHESVVHDLFNKIKSGQESHGFPPGYYLILMTLLFWPGAIFFPNFVRRIFARWNKRYFKKDELFLISWFFVPLLIYEFVPTKLPHYIFPSYAALSILISQSIVKKEWTGFSYKLSIFFLILFPIVITSGIFYIVKEYSNFDLFFWIIIASLAILIFLNTYSILQKKINFVLFFSGSFHVFIYLVAVYFLIPKLEKLWVSEKINNVVNLNIKNVDKILHFGFNEPSLIFLTSHKTLKKNIIDYSGNVKSEKILYVVTDKYSKIISEDDQYSEFKLLEEFEGFNYSQGKKVKIKFFLN